MCTKVIPGDIINTVSCQTDSSADSSARSKAASLNYVEVRLNETKQRPKQKDVYTEVVPRNKTPVNDAAEKRDSQADSAKNARPAYENVQLKEAANVSDVVLMSVLSLSSVSSVYIVVVVVVGSHHYECVVQLVTSSLQSGQLWVRSTASVHHSLWQSRSFCIVFIQDIHFMVAPAVSSSPQKARKSESMLLSMPVS